MSRRQFIDTISERILIAMTFDLASELWMPVESRSSNGCLQEPRKPSLEAGITKVRGHRHACTRVE